MADEPLAGRAEILHCLWGILCATFAEENLTGSGQVTELWRHKWYNLRPTFQRNRVFSHWTHWLEWRNYAWFRAEYNHIWHLTLHLDPLKVIRGHWPWLTPYIPIAAILAFFGFLEALGSNTWLIFHVDIYSAPSHYPMPIRAIDPLALRWFCPCRWRWPLPGCYASQIFHQQTAT